MTKKKKLLVFGVVAFFIIWIGAVFWANHIKESQSDSTEREVAVYTIPDPQKPVMTAGIMLQSSIICIAVGIIFGIIPARRASRLDPIEAIYR